MSHAEAILDILEGVQKVPSDKEGINWATKEERNLARQLIKSGHISGEILEDMEGQPRSFFMLEVTISGMLFADELKGKLRERTFRGQLDKHGPAIAGWLAGVTSALLILWFGKVTGLN